MATTATITRTMTSHATTVKQTEFMVVEVAGSPEFTILGTRLVSGLIIAIASMLAKRRRIHL